MVILGHIVGGVAVMMFFCSYQLKSKNSLLYVQTTATGLMCLQYFLIDAPSGFALNVVCVIRNLFFFHRDKKMLSSPILPYCFAVLMAVISATSWEGAHSLLIIAGLMINTVCLGICTPQGLRKSILLTSTLCAAYNVFAGSYAGLINESLSVISAAIGLYRFRKTKQEK